MITESLCAISAISVVRLATSSRRRWSAVEIDSSVTARAERKETSGRRKKTRGSS